MKNFKCCTFFPRRYLMTFLAFLTGLVTQSHRLNVSFALVAMVNVTNSQPKFKNQNITECSSFSGKNVSSSMVPAEFSWDPEVQGFILSCSYVGYFATQIIGGVLCTRYGIKPILFGSIFCASLANLASPAAARFHPYALSAVQFVKGMGQGPPSAAYPMLMARWFPICERGFLATFIFCGFPIGGFLGSLISGPISELDFDGGWPLIFYTFGMIGCLVSSLLLVFYVESPEHDQKISKQEKQYILQNIKSNAHQQCLPIPWTEILSNMSTYGLFIALFGQYWMLFYILNVHPNYMSTILNIPAKENGILTAFPQLAQAIAGFSACWLCFRMNRKDASKVNLFRKGFNSAGCLLYVLGMLGLYLSSCNTIGNEIFLFVIAASTGFTFAGCMIVAADMSPTFCGILMGIASTIASLSGFIVPVLVGYLTREEQTMRQFHKMFLITSSVVFMAGFAFLTLGSAECQQYDPAFVGKQNTENTSNLEKDRETTSTRF